MKLSATVSKWLKAFHIFLACAWGGGTSSLFAVHCLFSPDTGPMLYARNVALVYIDHYVITPASIGCLLTGLVYSQFTSWGYARYYWVMAKWCLLMLFIGTGLLGVAPWLRTLAEFSSTFRKYIRMDPSYTASMEAHFLMALFQVGLVFFLIVISVLKPWGRTKWHRSD